VLLHIVLGKLRLVDYGETPMLVLADRNQYEFLLEEINFLCPPLDSSKSVLNRVLARLVRLA